jgi:hypothetical protein
MDIDGVPPHKIDWRIIPLMAIDAALIEIINKYPKVHGLHVATICLPDLEDITTHSEALHALQAMRIRLSTQTLTEKMVISCKKYDEAVRELLSVFRRFSPLSNSEWESLPAWMHIGQIDEIGD